MENLSQLSLFENKITVDNKLVNSKSDFNVTQQKIVLYAISQIKQNDENFNLVKIPLKVIDVTGTNFNQVRNMSRKILKTSIEINIKEGKKETFLGHNIFSQIRAEKGESFLQIKFSEDMKPFLLNLRKSFTSYTLKFVWKFSCQYSLRFYEMLKQYQKIGKRSLELEYIRDILNLNYFCNKSNKQKRKYSNFNNFKSKVLNPAVVEINKFSDILISYEVEKEGRKVFSLLFSIKPQKIKQTNFKLPKGLEETAKNFDKTELEIKLENLGLNEEKITELLKNHEENFLVNKLEMLSEMIDDIKNPAGFFISSLEKDYKKADKNKIKKEFEQKKELEKIKNKKAKLEKIEKKKKLWLKDPKEWIKARDNLLNNQLIKNQELSYLFDGVDVVKNLKTKKFLFLFTNKAIEKKFKDILGIAVVGYLGIQEIKSRISNYEAFINL